jgi:hypothetical protein
MQIDNAESVHQSVSDYYGKVLHQTSDLKTNGKDCFLACTITIFSRLFRIKALLLLL